MIRKYRGFLAYLKEHVSGIFTIHCVIHRQHLVSKILSLNLHIPLNYAINTINEIKTNSLNSRVFINSVMKTVKNLIGLFYIQKFDGCRKEIFLFVLLHNLML